jgi:hypothetical protein
MTPRCVLAGAAIILGVGGCVGSARPSGTLDLQVAVQIRPLANQSVRSAEVEVTFLNAGQRELRIPLMSAGVTQGLFFDLLFVGSLGGLETVSGSGGTWDDPWVKPIELVALAAGQAHRVTFCVQLPELSETQAWWVVAVYRDHSYGHSPTYPDYGADHPDVWHGAAASNTVPLVRLPNTTQQPTGAPSGAGG